MHNQYSDLFAQTPEPVAAPLSPARHVATARRSLHVLGALVRAGLETWLMHVVRHTRRDRIAIDACVLDSSSTPGPYEEEFRALGGRIWRCPLHANRWGFSRAFRQVLREGRYTIVHSHVHAFSGWLLRMAARERVPVRIAHSHNDTRGVQSKAGPARRVYYRAMKRWIRKHATMGLACSDGAARALFGDDWRRDPRWHVLPYGIDLQPFHQPVNPRAVRDELGLPPAAPLWGHVGRFCPQKNHEFLLEIFREALQSEPNLHLVLIGDGPLRERVETAAAQNGIQDRIVFAGSRSDVPRLMLGAMDLFIFPSVHEGLPLALLEAQAAGLPCLVSSRVSAETDVVPSLVQRLSLQDSPRKWAQSALQSMNSERSLSCLQQVEASAFSIPRCAERLLDLYDAQATARNAGEPLQRPIRQEQSHSSGETTSANTMGLA